ncbi:MAG: hypothetical protein IKQ55_02710 [Kiritimatiellae bacterium]|nr:hypothetical protein [Kiritimatiellia bacterium]
MKKAIQALAVAVAAAVVLTGCMSFPGTIQDKTKPMEPNGYTVVGPQVQSQHWSWVLLGIPISDVSGSLSQEMYKSCLEKAGNGADALIEYSMDTTFIVLGPLGTITRQTMTGTPVKTK